MTQTALERGITPTDAGLAKTQGMVDVIDEKITAMIEKQDAVKPTEIIAIIPAAGLASRLPDISGSKEMINIGTTHDPTHNKIIPKPVCLHLIEKYRSAGIKKCIIVLRRGKWDIPQFFGSGEIVNMDLCYLMMGLPYGTAYTINQAYPHVKHEYVALGFPDILFSGDDG